jgi:hypothetical protein
VRLSGLVEIGSEGCVWTPSYTLCCSGRHRYDSAIATLHAERGAMKQRVEVLRAGLAAAVTSAKDDLQVCACVASRDFFCAPQPPPPQRMT